MKFAELIDNADKLEEEYELTECIYFGAIEKLRVVQADLRKLDDTRHLERVIKLFLIHWGGMNRVVGRENLEWAELGKTLRNLEKNFCKLRNKNFLTMKFDEPNVANAIKTIYEKIDPIAYLGSPTTISKILHLLNPEVFVMWDNDIVKKYHNKNRYVNGTAKGYLEFLKETRREIREALEERQKETRKALEEIEHEIRRRYKGKTLARIVDEYNWMTRKQK